MKDIEKIIKNLEEIIRVLKENKIDDTETPVDSVKKFIESVNKPGHVVDFSKIPVNDMHISAPQEEIEEIPDIKYFDIVDASDIIGDGAYSKYPLFTKYEDNSNYPVINYHIMEKFIYRNDVEILIVFALKGEGTCARATFKPSEVTVHVGGTTLTGKKEDGTLIEIRAGDWKKLRHATVKVRKK